MRQYKLTLLGGFHLANKAGDALIPGARKSKALLSWLAMNPDQQHPREKIASLFWPDSDEIQGRHSLRQALTGLRKMIPDNKHSPLLTTKEWISLNSDLIEIDAQQFLSALLHGDEASLSQAIELYKGEFLEGCNPGSDLFDDWVTVFRSHYSEQVASAIDQRLGQLIEEEDFAPVIVLAMRLLNIDPLRETAYRALMQAHFKTGNNAAALRWYRRCEHVLQRELGVAPDEQTTELYDAVVSAREPHAPAAVKSRVTVGRPVLKSLKAGRGKQRILYQLDSAIESIVDQIGGQSFLIRGEKGAGKGKLMEEIINVTRSHGFHYCRTDIKAKPLDERDKQPTCGTPSLSSCLTVQKPSQVKVNHEQHFVARKDGKYHLRSLIHTAASDQPLLLVVENIHAASAEMLEILAEMISAVGSCAALLVMTSRLEGEPLDTAWRGAMQGAPLTTIDLTAPTCAVHL